MQANVSTDGMVFAKGLEDPLPSYICRSKKSDWCFFSYRWLRDVASDIPDWDNFSVGGLDNLDHFLRRESQVADHLINRRVSLSGTFDKLFKIPLWESQKHAAEAIILAEKFYLADDVGLGKLQPITTKVLTSSGWCEIGSIQVGDEVIGSDGKPTRVTGVYPQGVKSVYRVTFSDHSSVEAGDEHLWTVRYRRGGRIWEELTLTTKQLRERSVLKEGRSRGGLDLSKASLYLPMLSGPVEFENAEELSIPPYTLGQLIANGSLIGGSSRLVTNSKDWSEVRENLNTGVGAIQDRDTCVATTVLGTIGCIRELGLDVKSGNKFIPEVYKLASPADRIALLQGLMDADGSITEARNRLSYCTTSHRLAEDVQELVEGLGGIASVRIYDRSAEGKPTDYQVRMRLPRWVLPFRISRKAERYNPGCHAYPVRVVKSVEYVRDVESVCIEVASEDGLYTTEHCILTHNTMSAYAAMALLHAAERIKNVLILATASCKYQWQEEIADFTGDHAVVIDGVRNKRLDGYDEPAFCHIASYESFRRDAEAGDIPCHYDAVVFDEAWKFKNYKSKLNRTLCKFFRSTRYRVALNAAPIGNGYHELFGVYQVLNSGVFMNWKTFKDRYCNFFTMKKGNYRFEVLRKDNPYRNLDDLKNRIRGTMIRRTVKSIGWEEPKVTVTPYWVELKPNQRKEYDRVRNDPGIDKIARLTLARQATLFSPNCPPDKSPKYQEFLNFVLEICPHEKIITFSESLTFLQGILNPLKSEGVKVGMICGPQNHKERELVRSEFMNGDLRVLLMTSAGESGLNLQASSVVVNLDLPWNADRIKQRVGRVRPYQGGKERSIRVINIFSKGTVEERVVNTVKQKIGFFARLFSEDVFDLTGVFDQKALVGQL